MNWLKQIYYRLRILRRLKEIKTGKRRTNKMVDPVTINDLIGGYDEELQLRLYC